MFLIRFFGAAHVIKATQLLIAASIVLVLPYFLNTAEIAEYYLHVSIFMVWSLFDFGHSLLLPLRMTNGSGASKDTLRQFNLSLIKGTSLCFGGTFVYCAAFYFFKNGDVNIKSTILVTVASTLYFSFNRYAALLDGMGHSLSSVKYKLNHSITLNAGVIILLYCETKANVFPLSCLIVSLVFFALIKWDTECRSSNDSQNNIEKINTKLFVKTGLTSVLGYLSIGAMGVIMNAVLPQSEAGKVLLLINAGTATSSMVLFLLPSKRRYWRILASQQNHGPLLMEIKEYGIKHLTIISAIFSTFTASLFFIPNHASSKLPPYDLTALALLAILIQQISSLLGTWSRSYMVEIFFASSLFQSIGGAFIITLLGTLYGMTGACAGLFFTATINIVWVFSLCRNQYRKTKQESQK